VGVEVETSHGVGIIDDVYIASASGSKAPAYCLRVFRMEAVTETPPTPFLPHEPQSATRSGEHADD